MALTLRVAPQRVGETGLDRKIEPGLLPRRGFCLAVAVALTLYAVAPPAPGRIAVPIALALLLFGLPHGALDLAVLRGSRRLLSTATLAIASLYCGCAAAMYAIWTASPFVALAVFMILAALHFAEDWRDTLPPFFAHGTATAILVAPALWQGQALAAVLTMVSDANAATAVVAVSVLLAPIVLITAVLGIALQWLQGAHARATETGFALAAMLILPPLPGFALFFCLLHSPGQYRLVAAQLRQHGRPVSRTEVTVLTAVALTIAIVLYGAAPHVALSQGVIAASFMTLSVLTLPHMAMPWLLRIIRHA